MVPEAGLAPRPIGHGTIVGQDRGPARRTTGAGPLGVLARTPWICNLLKPSRVFYRSRRSVLCNIWFTSWTARVHFLSPYFALGQDGVGFAFEQHIGGAEAHDLDHVQAGRRTCFPVRLSLFPPAGPRDEEIHCEFFGSVRPACS